MSKRTKVHSMLISIVYIVCIVLWIATSICLVLWIFKMFWSAYQELQYWNYKATRFRQLSFRFLFILFTSLFILLPLYFVTCFIASSSIQYHIFFTTTFICTCFIPFCFLLPLFCTCFIHSLYLLFANISLTIKKFFRDAILVRSRLYFSSVVHLDSI